MNERLINNPEGQSESPEAFLRRMRKKLEEIAEEGE
jgi:hypothetical protein